MKHTKHAKPPQALPSPDEDIRPEYDFSKGTRGRHYREMKAGYTVKIHHPDGTTIVKAMKPRKSP